MKLKWDQTGERLYETGTSKGALFVQDKDGKYGTGVAWNGLSAVKQSPDGAEENPVYADNIKYLALTSAEEFKGSIEAYTYPDEFAACEGAAEIVPGVTVGQQRRSTFGMVYETIVGNDTMHEDYGVKLHLIWGARVTPTSRDYETVNNDPNAIVFSWDFTTTPEHVSHDGIRPSAYLTVDSTKVSEEIFQAVKDKVYGTETDQPAMPSVDEFIDLVKGITTTP